MIKQMPAIYGLGRVLEAVEEINERVSRVAALLESASVSYAVVGGLAVGEWIGRVDRNAVRFTKDIDILIRRGDLDQMRSVMAEGGFIFGNSLDVDFFMDGPKGTIRNGVHLLYSGERVKPTDLAPAPDVDAWQPGEKFRVIGLPEIVTMKLTSYRRKDQVHLLDMIGVGLIDSNWPARFSTPLAARLQTLLDDPDG